MQPIKILANWLEANSSKERYIFTLKDLRVLFPELSDSAYRTLLSRTVRSGYLDRICNGIYIYKKTNYPRGLTLFHVASYMRSSDFNYISLETVLCDVGIISQMPINYITIMSSGRSYTVPCGNFGTIEFIHTNRKPQEVMNELNYDKDCRMWRARPKLALEDMKRTHRNSDLIDQEVANELIR